MNEHFPVHIHVSKGGAKAKIVLVPEIELVSNQGFKVRELRTIFEIVVSNYDYIVSKWYEAFNK